MDHPGVVEQQQAPSGKQLRQVAERVSGYSILTVEQQPGSISLQERITGYFLLGEMIMEPGYLKVRDLLFFHFIIIAKTIFRDY
jgi:hypothetical protein